jgi:F0F1-type ATP synthase assembly protein I
MQPEKPAAVDQKTKIFNLTLASVVAQVGCLTFVIILGAVLGGLWLDNYYGSKPIFTVGLLIVSIPVSLAVMILVVRYATSKIKIKQSKFDTESKETNIGKYS